MAEGVRIPNRPPDFVAAGEDAKDAVGAFIALLEGFVAMARRVPAGKRPPRCAGMVDFDLAAAQRLLEVLRAGRAALDAASKEVH
jgi:hypothetical protein